MIPFSREQFMAVFAAYNEAAWPAQWLLLQVTDPGDEGEDRGVLGGD